MENLISLVNKIQRACTALGDHGDESTYLPTLWDSLPSIAVVGGQKTAKKVVIVGGDYIGMEVAAAAVGWNLDTTENATVLTVVGKTFDELVLSGSKNVLLEVHTPWCMNCETTSKHVEKLAKHFKGLENLVFARIDASANEHPKLPVSDYPALLFYAAGDKSNPIKLSTKSSLKELAQLIKKNVEVEGHTHAKDEL